MQFTYPTNADDFESWRQQFEAQHRIFINQLSDTLMDKSNVKANSIIGATQVPGNAQSKLTFKNDGHIDVVVNGSVVHTF